MKKSALVFLIVIFLTIIGLFLRLYENVNNPISLSIDEVSFGYSAYSILKTGRDENGVFMPLAFGSTGDYKGPILIYSLIPAIAIFGLNEFSVRLTTVIFGALTIPLLFLLIRSLVKDIKIAFAGAMLLTISPWHIYYSRFASESLTGLFFFVLGIWLFRKVQQGWIWAFLSALTLVIAMYSYHSLRLFIPVFLLFLVLFEARRRESKRNNIAIFVLTSITLVLPLFYLMLFGQANTRAGMVFLSQDIDYTRYVILDHIQKPGEVFLLFFFWVKRYLNYFQPDFLFFSSLNMTQAGTLGLGVLYLFELPWFILGVISVVKRKIPNVRVLFLWIILGLLPASLANNEQSSSRSLVVLPMLILIVSIGAVKFFSFWGNLKNAHIKTLFFSVYTFLIVINLIQAFLIFSVHFPKQRGEAFMEGTKETVLFALSNKEKYKEIVYDPYRGIEAPYIVNIPYMYILFYSQYEPSIYQNEVKRYGQELYGFDKFTIRKIDWRVDREKANTLFIGSPWSLPQKDIKEEEILKRVYLSNGNLAFLIVSPRPD